MRFAHSRARLITALLFLLASLTPPARPSADATPLWLRYTAISPDGRTILFCYKGDIYSVPAAGGTATPKTLGESYEFAPVWSHIPPTRFPAASRRTTRRCCSPATDKSGRPTRSSLSAS